MRLQRAVPLSEFEGFAGPEEREARRARRSARRKARKTRKLERIQSKTKKLRKDAGLPRKKRRKKAAAAASASAASVAMPSSSSSMPSSWPAEPTLQPAPMEVPTEDWSEEDEVLDAEWEDVEPEEELEGIGAFRPLQRLAQARPVQQIKARVQARREARRGSPLLPRGRSNSPEVLSPSAPGWGPAVRMGRNLRIQAASGHRAAVIDLKPGLFLVAELPEAVTRTEFGAAPLLAPLMLRAARKAVNPGEPQPERRRPLAALFQRRQERSKKPFRLFRAREARPALPGPTPPALPGPTLQPPAGAGSGRSFLLAAPNVGWADDQDVAEVLGCEVCDEDGR